MLSRASQTARRSIGKYLCASAARYGPLALLAAVTLSAATDTGARFNDLGHRLMCMCGCSQVLLECNHVGCQMSDRMRAELMAGLDRGATDDQLMQGIIQSYGPVALAAPTHKGFDQVAWLMPKIVLFAFLALTMVLAWRWRKRSLKTAPARRLAAAGTAPADPVLRQVREETEL